MPFSVRRYAGRTTQSTDCAPYATVKVRHKTDSHEPVPNRCFKERIQQVLNLLFFIFL